MININEQILQALEKCKAKLSDEAISLIKEFIISQKNKNGGFIDRNGTPDPYYSVFGYSLAYIFEIPIDYNKEKSFLLSWSKTNQIDFVHAVSLIRCHLILAAIKYKSDSNILLKKLEKVTVLKNKFGNLIKENIKKDLTGLLKSIENYKTENGGYNHSVTNGKSATVYANFLVLNLFADLNEDVLSLNKLNRSVKNLEKKNGSFVNEESSIAGVTSSTSAGTIIKYLAGENVDKNIAWLKKQQNESGGFSAAENIFLPDLLSTATALTAIAVCEKGQLSKNPQCEDFVISHFGEEGGFFGSLADMSCDCEYTYYGLLAMGLT